MGPALRVEDEAGIPGTLSAESVPPATAFRSTWVVGSREALRGSPHWERYVRQLGARREEILCAIPGIWLPMELARAHYEACDALGLSSSELASLAEHADIRRAWWAPYIALAKRASSPWEVLFLLDRMWRRSADGGAVSVVRLHDQQARIDFFGCELLDIGYFREAVRMVLSALLAHICQQPEVCTLPPADHGHGCFLAQWT